MEKGTKIAIVFSAIIGILIGYAPRVGSIDEAEDKGKKDEGISELN
ncbi:hypothetical protein [Bacillus suaedae]|uniref:Uncharacterized protein n=1 Tax=Halalkalibacter suaedae TaxID=2822140 RepID=A0A941AP93_9BACI|nr:hypothetical protein [Bacillus suaedae]MBP3952525.1 hypothetical protein [Bacillus suaedae]